MADGLRSLVGSVVGSRSRRGAPTGVDCSGNEAEVPYSRFRRPNRGETRTGPQRWFAGGTYVSSCDDVRVTHRRRFRREVEIFYMSGAEVRWRHCASHGAGNGERSFGVLSVLPLVRQKAVPPAAPVLPRHRLVRLLQSRDIRLYAD